MAYKVNGHAQDLKSFQTYRLNYQKITSENFIYLGHKGLGHQKSSNYYFFFLLWELNDDSIYWTSFHLFKKKYLAKKERAHKCLNTYTSYIKVIRGHWRYLLSNVIVHYFSSFKDTVIRLWIYIEPCNSIFLLKYWVVEI